jgi:hypothetical protein
MAAGMAADEIAELLHELARRLNDRGTTATIRVVGGAALVAREYRTTTTFDMDAIFQPEDAVLEVAAELANERGLPFDWLNSDAKAYLPFVAPGPRAAPVQRWWRHRFDRPSTNPAGDEAQSQPRQARRRRRRPTTCGLQSHNRRASPADLRELPTTRSPGRRSHSANRDLHSP